jgi:hypothetical protein
MANQGERTETSQAEQPARDQGPSLGLENIDAKQILGTAASFAREHPHAAIAGAFGIGFLLGGGLSPRLLGGVAMLAGRRYWSQIARATLEGVLRDQLGRGDEA